MNFGLLDSYFLVVLWVGIIPRWATFLGVEICQCAWVFLAVCPDVDIWMNSAEIADALSWLVCLQCNCCLASCHHCCRLSFSQHVGFFRGWQPLSYFTGVLSRLFLFAISLLARASDVKKLSMMIFLPLVIRSVRCISTQTFTTSTVSLCVKGMCWVCIWCPKFDAKLDCACSVLSELALPCHLA